MARDGREAHARLGKARPEAVVLDMMMPVHDGLEVLRRVRSSDEHAHSGDHADRAPGEADVIGALELAPTIIS